MSVAAKFLMQVWGGRPRPLGGPCLRLQQRDEGVPRGPGGPPHQAAAIAVR